MALCAPPAHAEFFNDVKRTFQTDVPHFFQDDIPCAFGGQPTSGTKASCHARPADPARTPLRSDTTVTARPAPAPPPQPLPPPPQPQRPYQY